jgi:hypothetical protein
MNGDNLFIGVLLAVQRKKFASRASISIRFPLRKPGNSWDERLFILKGDRS